MPTGERRRGGFRAFLRLSRPHFLLGGFLLFAIGALSAPSITLQAYLIGQFAVTMAQITAHYLNEYADYEADKAVVNRTAFSGGSGVLSAGVLPRIMALRAGQITTLLALCGCIELLDYNAWAALTVLLALIISWTYSMPPARLLRTGWGEAATALAVTVLVPLTGALSQGDAVAPTLWWMMAVLFGLQMAMLLAFELPDLESDGAVGKRVLGVRIGAQHTQSAIGGAVLVSIATALVGVAVGQLPAAAVLYSLPASVPAGKLLMTVRTGNYRVITLSAVSTFFLYGVGFALSLL